MTTAVKLHAAYSRGDQIGEHSEIGLEQIQPGGGHLQVTLHQVCPHPQGVEELEAQTSALVESVVDVLLEGFKTTVLPQNWLPLLGT